MILTEYLGELDTSSNLDYDVTIGDLLHNAGGESMKDHEYCDESEMPVELEDFETVKEMTKGIPKDKVVEMIKIAKKLYIDESIKHFISEGFIYHLQDVLDHSYSGVDFYIGNRDLSKIASIHQVLGHDGTYTSGCIAYKKHIGKIVRDHKGPNIKREEVKEFDTIIASFDHRKIRLLEHHYFSCNDPDIDYRKLSKKDYEEVIGENFFPGIYLEEAFGYDTIDMEIETMLDEFVESADGWIKEFKALSEKYEKSNPYPIMRGYTQLKLVS